MVDLHRVVGFDWDAGNAIKNSDKHNVDAAEAEQVFSNEPLTMMLDERHSGTEVRFHALGVTNAGRKLHLTFTLREDETLVRVVSARDMSRRERSRYEQ